MAMSIHMTLKHVFSQPLPKPFDYTHKQFREFLLSLKEKIPEECLGDLFYSMALHAVYEEDAWSIFYPAEALSKIPSRHHEGQVLLAWGELKNNRFIEAFENMKKLTEEDRQDEVLQSQFRYTFFRKAEQLLREVRNIDSQTVK
jgi:hypothetical protein